MNNKEFQTWQVLHDLVLEALKRKKKKKGLKNVE